TTDQLVKHAREAFDLAQARYRAGSSSVIELSQAQLSETSASITQVNARYDALIEKAVLDYQSGAMNTGAAQP
ncbi:MAG TPA: TolC family protein, partial [Opitutaceae bacterium]